MPGSFEFAEVWVSHVPGEVEGHRDQAAFELACRLKDFGLSEQSIAATMLPWDARNSPPLGSEIIEVKARSAYSSGLSRPGCCNPLWQFQDVIVREPRAEKISRLLEAPSEISLDAIVGRQTDALVKYLLMRGQQGTFYAMSTAGKTFVAIDLAYHIALGRKWHGRKVKKAPVLYVCLEDVPGFQKRLYAASMHHGDPGLLLRRLVPPVSLNKSKRGIEGVALIAQAAKEMEKELGEPVGLIIIDTKQRATAGDNENDQGDATIYSTDRVGEIRRLPGAAVITVHHPNKSGGFRGSNVLPGDDDLTMTIDYDKATGRRTVIAEKVKEVSKVHFLMSISKWST